MFRLRGALGGKAAELLALPQGLFVLPPPRTPPEPAARRERQEPVGFADGRSAKPNP